jgi:hypothetical protein
MSDRFHGRLHHSWGMIHTTVEGAFLTAGLVLSTLVTLLAVCAAVWMMGR